MNKDELNMLTLAALLHDVGKFAERAGVEKNFPEVKDKYEEYCLNGNRYPFAAHTDFFIQQFVPDGLFDKTELSQSVHHHESGDDDLYKDADCLSSGMERFGTEPDQEKNKRVRLHSIFDMIELQYSIRDKDGDLNSRWMHRLVESSGQRLSNEYPVFVANGSLDDNGFTYQRLWEMFACEAKELKGIKTSSFYFTELYWLLEKYLSCIPSTTNAAPDISLFDHAKTTAAISSCLHLMKAESNSGKPEFLLYGGDISGIQEYIFKISQIQGVGGIAKRLRGRSFRVAMLSEILSRYLLNELGLTTTNVNFCGGGNFELLLPNSKVTNDLLNEFEAELSQRLLEEFHGDLGFVGGRVLMSRQELRDNFSAKRDELGDSLNVEKLNKYKACLGDKPFWIENRIAVARITICKSCNLNLVPSEDTICSYCDRDKKLGEQLPKSNCLIFSIPGKPDALGIGRFGDFELMDERSVKFLDGDKNNLVYALNNSNDMASARFQLARTVPKATKNLPHLETEMDETGDGTVKEGRSLSFATLADMAQGDKKIAILKMDVDNLGLIFSMGLETSQEKGQQKRLRSISRFSTLSRQLSAFFTSHLDAICCKVFNNWREDGLNSWPDKEAVSNIFYLIFAGGDDLVIVGPWDRIIELAREIRKEFKEFTCYNPNLTISAGIYICKPKYPISHAVNKAEEALQQSKNKGRNRITVMGETAVWGHEDSRSRVHQEAFKSRYASFEKNEISGESVNHGRSAKPEGDPCLPVSQRRAA